MRLDTTAELLQALTPDLAFDPVQSIRGGAAPGTFVVKELVYAYAMWISASFNFNTSSIRVVTIDDQPWFVGADVLRILFGSTSGMGHCYDRLDAAERCKVKRIHLGAAAGKDMEAVSESGLYKLIMRSDKPQAKAFQDWVTKEVLPSIRKTGSFVTATQ